VGVTGITTGEKELFWDDRSAGSCGKRTHLTKRTEHRGWKQEEKVPYSWEEEGGTAKKVKKNIRRLHSITRGHQNVRGSFLGKTEGGLLGTGKKKKSRPKSGVRLSEAGTEEKRYVCFHE